MNHLEVLGEVLGTLEVCIAERARLRPCGTVHLFFFYDGAQELDENTDIFPFAPFCANFFLQECLVIAPCSKDEHTIGFFEDVHFGIDCKHLPAVRYFGRQASPNGDLNREGLGKLRVAQDSNPGVNEVGILSDV